MIRIDNNEATPKGGLKDGAGNNQTVSDPFDQWIVQVPEGTAASANRVSFCGWDFLRLGLFAAGTGKPPASSICSKITRITEMEWIHGSLTTDYSVRFCISGSRSF